MSTYAPVLSTAVDTSRRAVADCLHWIILAMLAGMLSIGAVFEPTLGADIVARIIAARESAKTEDHRTD